MAEEQDPEVPDVPEHDLSEEDMMFVSLLYNYILALEAERGGRTAKTRSLSNWPLPVLLWLFFAAPLPLLGPIII